MDPNATMERIVQARIVNDREGVADACADLLTWIHKGGAVPLLTGNQLSTLLTMSQLFCKHVDTEKWETHKNQDDRKQELHDLQVCFCKVTIQRHAQNPDDWATEQMEADKERWPEAFKQAMLEKG